MSFSKFDNVSQATAKEMTKYVEFLLWQYRLVDAFWFLKAEKAFNLEVAEKLDENVWSTIGKHMARDIKHRFKISEKGIDAVLEALSYNPWTTITKYVVQKEEDKTILYVPICPPQIARQKHGKKEFRCKKMHMKFFANFAKEIDTRVKVRCLFAPPDPHPEDVWCKWEFFNPASSNTRKFRK
jgi:hypothetical protein